MEVIVPAAGKSTRFPNMKPKYLLYDYDNQLMLKRSLGDLIEHNITIVILKEHDDMFDASTHIRLAIPKAHIVVLDNHTRGPADTVFHGIKARNIDESAPLLIKDCDSFFSHIDVAGSYVCVSDITEHETLYNLASKSFIVSNEQGIITDIVEKQVVSNKFSVGGYKFDSVWNFKKYFDKCTHESEIFVSDVISAMLLEQHTFIENHVTNYIDVGTSQDWFRYNDKCVFFCDIDGTIIEAQSRIDLRNGVLPKILFNNVNTLLEKQKNGSQFIFTTARESLFDAPTRDLLNSLGFKHYRLISGLLNAKRVLINDFNTSNPYPRADAINIERNSDTLNLYLK